LWLFYRFLVRFRYTTSGLSLIVTALWGFSGMAVSAAGMVLSEPLCTLLMVAALWYCALASERDGASARLPALMAGVFCGLTFLARSAALLLIVAVAWEILRKSRRTAGWPLLGAVPFISGWLAWSRNHPRLEPWDLRLHYLDYVKWSIWQYQL